MRLDLVIEGGLVVDGSGAPGVVADVGIGDGLIAAIGDLSGAQAVERVDATGLVVAPGFIDPHTHIDAQLFWDPMAAPLVLHGVTTAVMGNCSVTLAPCRPDGADELARMFFLIEEVPIEALRAGVPWSWDSFGEFLAALDGRLGINCAALVGHSALRHHVMGSASIERAADAHELAAMRELLRECIRAGAFGFSTSQNRLHVLEGGLPIPSRVASADEIVALCDVLGEEGTGIIQTDGGEGIRRRARWIDDVGRTIARRTSRPVLAGNVFSTPGSSDGWRDILRAVEECQDQGLRVFVQANPTRLDAFFHVDGGILSGSSPTWSSLALMSPADRLRALHDPGVRDRMQDETVDNVRTARDWSNIRVSRTGAPHLADLVGTSVAEIAVSRGVRVIDAFFDLVIEDRMETEFVEEGINNREPADVVAMLRSPQAIIGSSDAGAHVKTFCGSGNTTYVLAHWVRDTASLSLEEAVQRLTSTVASVLGLGDRGLLKPGYAADVVVFDLDGVRYEPTRVVDDLPTGATRLWRDAPGIHHVVVNGAVAVRDGTPTGARSGQILQSTA
jgi:N-acyl-D-aspartate/D-glutamate deacylase